jgi:cell wall-associated NlpC family hydrolase
LDIDLPGRESAYTAKIQANTEATPSLDECANLTDLDPEGGTPAYDVKAKSNIATEANKYVGGPYRYGGNNPRTGIDCSGFAKWCVNKAGYSYPTRTVATQFPWCRRHCERIDLDHIQAGDILFFTHLYANTPHHTGIAVGGDSYVHAACTKCGIIKTSIKAARRKRKVHAFRIKD